MKVIQVSIYLSKLNNFCSNFYKVDFTHYSLLLNASNIIFWLDFCISYSWLSLNVHKSHLSVYISNRFGGRRFHCIQLVVHGLVNFVLWNITVSAHRGKYFYYKRLLKHQLGRKINQLYVWGINFLRCNLTSFESAWISTFKNLNGHFTLMWVI